VYDWTGAFSGSGSSKSISTAGAYTAQVRSAQTSNGITCYSAYTSLTGTITAPGGNGQAATCGCVSGTINCSGTCRTNSNYTTNDGNCTSSCNYAYVQQRNACGTVINSTYNTYYTTSCKAADYTTNDGACTGNCTNYAYVQLRDGCTGAVKNSQYSTYYTSSCYASNYTTNDGACTGSCNTAYVQLRNGCTGAVINAQYSTYSNSSCTSGCCTPGGVGQAIPSCGCQPGLTEYSGYCIKDVSMGTCRLFCCDHGYYYYRAPSSGAQCGCTATLKLDVCWWNWDYMTGKYVANTCTHYNEEQFVQGVSCP
jgi:hypothetical protein